MILVALFDQDTFSVIISFAMQHLLMCLKWLASCAPCIWYVLLWSIKTSFILWPCVYEFGIYWNQGNKWAGESNYSFPFLNSNTFLVWAVHYLLLIKVWYGLEAIPNLLYVCPKPTSECVFRRYYQLLTYAVVWSIWKKGFFLYKNLSFP